MTEGHHQQSPIVPAEVDMSLPRRGRDGDIYLPEAPDGAVVFGGFFDRTDCLSCLKMFQDSCKICHTFSIY